MNPSPDLPENPQIVTESPVVVYILTSDAESQRTNKVRSLFDNGLFIVRISTISPPKNGSSSKSQLEAYRYQWCLENARQQYPDKHVLIVKDTSVSNSSPERIADIVSSALVAGGWDVFYLCRWLDRCNLYSEKRPISGMTTLLAKTVSPHGTQALLFSPRGRDIVLGKETMSNGEKFSLQGKSLGSQLNDAIAKGHISAQCTVPNLIEYDVTTAKSSDDYHKLSECDTTIGKSHLQQNSGFGWIWLIIVLVIVVLIVWFVSRRRSSSFIID